MKQNDTAHDYPGKKLDFYIDNYENAPDMLASVKPETGKIIQCNLTLCKNTGYKKSEIIGKPMFEMYHSDCINQVRQVFEQMVNTGEINDKELQLLHKKGKKIEVSLNVTSVRDKKGKIKWNQCSWRDITNKKRTEKTLAEQKDFLEQLFNAIDTGIIIIEPDSKKIFDINPTALKMIGASKNEVVGKICHEFLCPCDKGNCPVCDKNEKVHQSERKLLTKDGRELDVLKSVIAIQIENKEYLLESFINISERKQALKKLEQREYDISERYKELKCIFGVVESIRTQENIEDIFKETINHVLEGWQYPRYTRCKIIYNDKEYVKKKFKETKWKLSSNIIVDKKKYGTINVFYTKEFPKQHEGPFLQEERWLIDSIARNLSEAIDSIRTKKALTESMQKFKRLAENAQDMIYRMSLPDGEYEYVSPAAKDIWGYTPQECYAKPKLIAQCIHPDFHEYFKKEWTNLISGKMPPVYEYKIVDKIGKEKWLSQRNVLVKDQKGKPIAIEGIVTDVTHKKQAETKLQQQHQQLLSMFDGIDDVIYVADPETYEILYFNDTAKQLWGEKSIGKKCYKILQNRNEPCSFCTNDKIFGENIGKPYEWEFRNEVTGDWFRCFDKAILWSDNRWVRFEMAANINQLKQHEQNLKREKDYANQVIDSIPGLFYQISTEGRFVKWNKNFEHVSGYNEDEMEKISPLDLFEGDDKLHIAERIQAVFEKGQSFAEAQFVSKSGVKTPYYFTGRLIKIDDQVFLAGMGMDISEIKKTEQALKTSKRELEIRNEINNVFLTKSNEEMFIEILNITLKTLKSKFGVFGYINSETGDLVVPTMTRHIWDKCNVPEKDIIFPKETWGDSLWCQAIRQKQLKFSNKPSKKIPKGHIAISRNAASPIIHKDVVIGLLQVANKTTDYTEDDFYLLNKLCEIIAPVLYARLVESKLEIARKQAEDLLIASEKRLKILNNELMNKNKELEQVLYATSHDLRSPLVNVQGFNQELKLALDEISDLLKEVNIPPPIKVKIDEIMLEDVPESLHYILSSTTQMDALLTGLLTLSRLGRQELQIKKLNMNDLLQDVLENFEYRLKQNNITIKLEHLPACNADEAQMNQVFSNLIGNAIKFLKPNQKGMIKISGKKQKKGVLYFVEDNGIGIKPEFFEKVFDLFHKLNPDIDGKGLGLTIVKQIIDRHHGSIQLDSKWGEGTTFKILLNN